MSLGFQAQKKLQRSIFAAKPSCYYL